MEVPDGGCGWSAGRLDGLVYIGSDDNYLYAVDTGERHGEVEVSDGGLPSVLADLV